MDRTHRLILAFLVIGAMGAVPYLAGALYVPPPPMPPPPPAFVEPVQVVERLPIESGDTMDGVLARTVQDPGTRLELLNAFNDAFDVRKVRAGNELVVTKWQETGEVALLEYIADADHAVTVYRGNGVTTSEFAEIPGIVREVAICERLDTSLAASMDRAGESFLLAMMLAETLAYDIDFYRDPQPGDDFCVLVEKKFYDNGNPATYKRILGARYNNHGAVSSSFLFSTSDGKSSYYGPNGESHKAAFLRSPLEFDARISSHFSMSRLHPVLHTTRAHYGTDYAAPTGTPVRSVADGKVVSAGMSGGSGNLVTIRHDGGYQTQYLHLSKILVRAGQSVEQGTRIGLVGQTGLATGPHLDIRISKNGTYLNWEKLRSPKVVSLDGSQKQTFHVERDRMLALMNAAPKPAAPATLASASSGNATP
jgi:murein DD-endopeptidase MepM/ murein hydrolase activator NlpD